MRNQMIHRDSNKKNDATTSEFIIAADALLVDLTRRNNYAFQLQSAKLEDLKNKEVTAEMFDKAMESDIQGILNEISDRIAAGEDVTDLITRLKNAMKEQAKFALGHDISEIFNKMSIDNEQLNQAVQKLQGTNAKLNNLITELKADNAEKEKKLEHMHELQERNIKLTSAMKLLKDESDALKSRLEEMKRQVSERDERILQLRNYIETLEDDGEKSEKYIEYLEDEIKKKENEIERMKNENQQKDGQIQRLRDTEAELRDLEAYIFVVFIIAIWFVVFLMRAALLY